jgi:hypothetical protein
VAILRAHSRRQAPSPLARSDAKALYGGLVELHRDGADRLDSQGSILLCSEFLPESPERAIPRIDVEFVGIDESTVNIEYESEHRC